MKNNQEILISIIIPAYNVATYIEKCILSITSQDYHNLQIIVVNDGSTDNTQMIIEKCCIKDNRVELINIVNGGVSNARNIGMEYAKGDYVIFVDGDDYLANDFVSYMSGLAIKTKAELCLSMNCFLSDNDSQVDDKINVLNSADATALLLSPRIIVGCWNKIYKRSFLVKNNIKFNTLLYYGEGLDFITTVSQKATKIAVGYRKVYYYRLDNPNSATTVFNVNKLINGEKALNNIFENLINRNELIIKAWQLHMWLFSLDGVIGLVANNQTNGYEEEYLRWKTNVKRGLLKYCLSHQIANKKKILAVASIYFPFFINLWIKQKRKKATK